MANLLSLRSDASQGTYKESCELELNGFLMLCYGVRIFENRKENGDSGDRKWFKPRSYLPRWNLIDRVDSREGLLVVTDWKFSSSPS